jgi:hypothetical protein
VGKQLQGRKQLAQRLGMISMLGHKRFQIDRLALAHPPGEVVHEVDHVLIGVGLVLVRIRHHTRP